MNSSVRTVSLTIVSLFMVFVPECRIAHTDVIFWGYFVRRDSNSVLNHVPGTVLGVQQFEQGRSEPFFTFRQVVYLIIYLWASRNAHHSQGPIPLWSPFRCIFRNFQGMFSWILIFFMKLVASEAWTRSHLRASGPSFARFINLSIPATCNYKWFQSCKFKRYHF